MDNMNKALDAVNSLAALVDALRQPVQQEQGTVTISRYEYETLIANQACEPDAVIVPDMDRPVCIADSGAIRITKEDRYGLLKEMISKPARLLIIFDRFPYDDDYDGIGNLFAGTEIALRNTDCIRVYVPFSYDKDLVIKSLLEIADFVQSDWVSLSKDAAHYAAQPSLAPDASLIPF